MSVIQKGNPIVFGIGSGAAKLIKSGDSGNPELTVYLQDVRYNKNADTQEVMDGNGEVTGKVFFNQKNTLTMTCFVSGLNKATSETLFQVDIDPGDRLEVSYNEWLEVASDNASSLTGTPTNGTGQWVVDSSDKTRTSGGIAEWSITATMYANDITADAS